MTHASRESQNASTALVPPGPDPRAWLEHLPAPKRSSVANWFHYAVRNGASTPPAVCSAVWQTVQQRLQWSSELPTRQFLQGVLDTLRATQQDALTYAQHVIDYERLPYEARQRVKAERTFAYLKDAMHGKPATPAQLSYLGALGYRGEPPTDRAQASALIDALLQQQGGGA